MLSDRSSRQAVTAAKHALADSSTRSDRKARLVSWLRIWKQVFMGELLNALERRRYDLKRTRSKSAGA